MFIKSANPSVLYIFVHMKFYDVIIVGLLALVPFGMSEGWLWNGNLWAARISISVLLIIALIYFAMKCFSIFVATYSEQTFFRASVNVELNDILTGGFWGIVIYQYYQMDYGFLIFWLFIGIFIFTIGFISGAVMNENNGIRLRKGEKWIPWSEISVLYENQVFVGFQLDNNRQYPVLADKVSKVSFEKLRKGIQKVAEKENILIAEIPEKSSLLLGEAHFEEDGDALDDFIAKIKSFVLIEPKGFLFSDDNQLITWENIIKIELRDDNIFIEYNQNRLKQKRLYQDDFNLKDWEKLVQVVSFEARV
jgi:hypothetical protein|tara:strand:- start:102 stop:1022 length:921 start_codon:yes stop_codon:yes gene_type:complete